jgi:hypothetical protein
LFVFDEHETGANQGVNLASEKFDILLQIHRSHPACAHYGRTVVQWCFAPEGGLAPGDILLAQKIALETMEREVLALANKQTSRACLLVPLAAP